MLFKGKFKKLLKWENEIIIPKQNKDFAKHVISLKKNLISKEKFMQMKALYYTKTLLPMYEEKLKELGIKGLSEFRAWKKNK